MPHVQWIKRGEDLQRVNLTERVPGEVVLVLDGVSVSETYSCEADSESGFVAKEVEVRVLGPPPPQNVRLSSLTETMAVIAWDPVEEAKFYTVFKNYSSSQGEAVDVFQTNSHVFADLEPYTKYEFRVAVVTASDQIALSESIFAITGDTAPDPPTIKGLDTVLKFDVGEAVNLTCVSGGGISPLVLTWYKNGVEMVSAEIRSGLQLSLVLQEEDDGAELLCQAANYVAAVNTSVVALIKEGVCKVPEEWAGEWYSGWDQVGVASDLWLDQICLTSSRNRFLVKKEWRDCNTCYIVTEKHPNILEYKESQCEATDDLQALCSTIDPAQPPTHVMRMDSTTECPFLGLRPFTYRLRHRSCTDEPSRLTSENNGTELVFHYDPCADDTDLHIDVRSERIECVGTWSEGNASFLMGKLESILGGEPRYRCFTFAEEEGEEEEGEGHRYAVSRTSSEACAALGESSDSSYKIFGEAVAPGEPTILGHDASEQVKFGAALNLTCSSGGGFPRAKLSWFKDGEAIPSETFQEGGNSVAVVEVTVEGPDNETEYLCRAYNFVADFSASVVLRVEQASLPAFEDIMVPTVVVVEDETAFLPCIRTQAEDIKMDWFDADIETQLTAGTTILADEKTHLQPWISDGVMGLMVLAGFVDTNYACNVNGRRVGNTRAVILARYLIGEGGYEASEDSLDYTDYHKTVQEGSDVFLNCIVGSNSSSSTVRWRRSPGSVLLTQNDISLAEDEGYTVDVIGNSYILYVARADVRHAGSYFCQIIVDEVEVYTKNFTINIDELTHTYVGQNGSINCYALPGEEITFIHEGQEIHPATANETDKYSITRTEERGQALTGRTGTLFTLTVFNASLHDEGLYQCVINRDYGDVILREAVLLVDLEDLTPYTNESATGELPTTTPATTTPFGLFDWWSTTTTPSYQRKRQQQPQQQQLKFPSLG
ncbi:uncharacterized protein LOC125047875 isoform X2 [Penaeus chinensis]|uniref:uncharacterized protein LOC125047875 isoform X2 n=1 Tax=Penaeus chinensis TaxID=139456 RepID=UPI001FB7A51F|nr:uncharacterized protein LOC125047875 isoform X2 [Penaeus chinensis]